MTHVLPEAWGSCPGSLGSRPALRIDTQSYSYTLYHTDAHILHITHPHTYTHTHTPADSERPTMHTHTYKLSHSTDTQHTYTPISYTHNISHTHQPSYVPHIIHPPPTCPQVNTPTTHTLVHTDTYTTYHKHASHTEHACHTHSMLCRKTQARRI